MSTAPSDQMPATAAEVRVEADYTEWYGSERAPLSEVTAGLYADDE